MRTPKAWLSRASGPGADRDGPEAVLPKHLASIAVGLARLQWKDSTAGRILRMMGSVWVYVLGAGSLEDPDMADEWGRYVAPRTAGIHL